MPDSFKLLSEALDSAGLPSIREPISSLPLPERERLEHFLRLVELALQVDPRQLAAQWMARIPGAEPEIMRHALLRPLRVSLEGPGDRLRRVLMGHSDRVFAIASSPDERRVATGGADGRVCVWDLQSGELLGSFWGPREVAEIAWLPDGRELLVVGWPGDLLLCDVETGLATWIKPRPRFSASCISVLPDGSSAVCGSTGGQLDLVNLTTGRARTPLKLGSRVLAVAALRDGLHAAVALQDQSFRLVDLKRLKEIPRDSQPRWERCLAVGELLLSGDQDGALRAMDPLSGALLWRVDAGESPIRGLRVKASKVYSWSGQDLLEITSVASGERLRALRDARVGPGEVVSDTILTSSTEGSVSVWGLDEGEAPSFAEHPGVCLLRVEGQETTSLGRDGTLRRWRAGVPLGATRIDVPQNHFRVWSLTDRWIVGGSVQGEIDVWDRDTGAHLHKLQAHPSDLQALATLPNGLCASADLNSPIALQDLSRGLPLRTLPSEAGLHRALALSQDALTLVVGNPSGIQVWDIEPGILRNMLGKKGIATNALAISADGALLLSGDDDLMLRVWELPTGRLRSTLAGPTRAIKAVAFSPDGTWAASAGLDATLRVWDLRQGTLAANFTCGGALVALVMGERELAVAEFGGRVHFLSYGQTQ